MVAVGDISTCLPPDCASAETAALAESLSPQLVLVLGDAQYESGSLEEYRQEFAKTWGRLRSVIRPVPGNHDYETERAAGYFDWFGDRAAPRHGGFYSFDVGNWHLVALNTNDQCSTISCDESSRQVHWLRADLAQSDQRCLLGFWHHPRWSSGAHGDDPHVDTLWRVLAGAHADVVLNGHDHDYERFAPSDAFGRPARDGTTEFVVGTGGGELRGFEEQSRGPSVRRVENHHGVLGLALGSDSYQWQFVSVTGETLDRGGPVECH